MRERNPNPAERLSVKNRTSVSSGEHFSHLDRSGNVSMVDVGRKPVTRRLAIARAVLSMKPGTLKAIVEDKIRKGNVFTTAKLAGIMAAKKVGELIPLCHPLDVERVELDFTADPERGILVIRSEVAVRAKTGAEMEALQAATQAALTVYDMCKAVDRGMVVSEIALLEKSGGKSGPWRKK
jgi:cyclic pyranopterin phosphate synthase